MARKRLVLAGIVGRYPVGGVTWCALQYIAGFQRLGYDVFWLGARPVSALMAASGDSPRRARS